MTGLIQNAHWKLLGALKADCCLIDAQLFNQQQCAQETASNCILLILLLKGFNKW
jgi:hypothetical protein